jgi:hypothetical protein
MACLRSVSELMANILTNSTREVCVCSGLKTDRRRSDKNGRRISTNKPDWIRPRPESGGIHWAVMKRGNIHRKEAEWLQYFYHNLQAVASNAQRPEISLFLSIDSKNLMDSSPQKAFPTSVRRHCEAQQEESQHEHCMFNRKGRDMEIIDLLPRTESFPVNRC